jgi:hypothetical protein
MVESSEQIAAKELEEKMTEMVVEEKPVESAKLSKAAKKRLKEKEKKQAAKEKNTAEKEEKKLEVVEIKEGTGWEQDNSHIRLLGSWKADETRVQTHPATIPIVAQYPKAIYPIAQTMEYV